MIEVVFADKSASKLGLLVREAETPVISGDLALAPVLLFAILERAAVSSPAVNGAAPVPVENLQLGKARKARQAGTVADTLVTRTA